MSGFLGVFHLHPCSMGQSIQRMLPFLSIHREETEISHSFIERGIEIGAVKRDFFYSRKKNTLLSYTGKIENLKTIIEDLHKEGLKPKTSKTEEVLLLAFKAWGKEFASRLLGRFAIMIYSRKRDTVYLFRDPVGEKPLYWFKNAKDFVFSTQLKALLASGLVPQTPSLKGMGAFFQLGFVPQNLSLIKNVHTLLPGHYLEYRVGRFLTVTPYKSLEVSLEEKDKTPLLIQSLKDDKNQSDALLSFHLKQGEQKCKELYSEPLQITPLPTINISDLIDELPLMVWVCERPFADAFLPFFMHKQSQYCKKNGIERPMCALGQNNTFLPTDLVDEDYPFATTSSQFRTYLTRLIAPFLGMREFPVRFELPWLEDFLEELDCPLNIKQLAKDPTLAFSPAIFIKSIAYHLPAKSVRSFIFHFYNLLKFPSDELLLKNAFSDYHQVEWRAPFIEQSMYLNLSHMKLDHSPHTRYEINQSDFSAEDIKKVKELIFILKNGKLAELGLINSLEFEKTFMLTKNTFSSMHLLWPFITLELWMQTFVDTTPKLHPPAFNFQKSQRF